MIGTSPSEAAHVIVVQNLLAIFSQQRQAHLLPTDPHGPRCSDFVAYPGFIRPHARSESEAQYLIFPSAHLVDHGTTPRPIDTAIQSYAVHMTMDLLALGDHWDCLCTVDVFVTPPASQALAHGAFGALEFLPVPTTAVSWHVKTSQKGRSQTLSLLSTLEVLMSSFLHVLVHHNDSGLGSTARSSSSSMMSFIMQINLSR